MLSHVALSLRLVYERRNDDAVRRAAQADGGDPAGAWELTGILPVESETESGEGADEASAGSLADAGSATEGARRHVTGPMVMTLDRDEADGYYLNLTSPQPSVFALLRHGDVASATPSATAREIPQAVAITASYSEAARWMDGGMVVVRTLLPQPLQAWIAEFAQYHFPIEGPKKRGKYRPSFLSRQEFGDKAKAALRDLEPGPGDKRH